MATCIVSRAMQLDGAAALSGILLTAGIAAYLVLAAVYAGRLAINRAGVRADAADPGRAFGFFTLAAGSNVLAARLAADDHLAAAAVLLVIGGISWAGLGYLLPPLLAARGLGGASGSWFLWPVATQSVAVGLTSLPPPRPDGLGAVAVACWAVGVIGYLLVAGLVTAARLAFPVRPAALTPGYWVFMGASAISVLAGAQILRLPPSPLTTATHAVVAGSSVMLWAFGTWLVPLLLIMGVWRHVRHRVPLAYETGMWSMVFPIGMYGVASRELGSALRVPWLVTLGRDEAWLALAAWAAVSLAMTLAALPRRAPAPASGSGSGSGHLYRVTMLNTLAAARCLPDPGRVVAAVKRYKFQALVALNGQEPDARPGRDPRRMVLRGRNDDSRHSKFFTALVSCDDDGPFRPGGRQQLVTVRLAGDDVADYFSVGGHFDVWMGDDVGQGVITRRLFV
jgi:tellurite resistance protein TehA-like permease